jgi:hypothetical protein
MLKRKNTISFGFVMGSILASALSSSAVHASQFVADLVPNAWETVTRQVLLRDKMYSANLYGAPAAIQVMFKDGVSPGGSIVGK